MVCHRCPVGARFAFNFYRHWAQLLLRHPGDALVIFLSQEGVTQGDPLSTFLYGITLTPLEEELMDADTTFLSPFYTNDAAFDGPVRRSAAQLCLLMDQREDRGYFPEPPKSLFIVDNPEEEEVVRQEF